MRKPILTFMFAFITLAGSSVLLAQVGENTNEIGGQVGWTFGDDLLEQSISNGGPSSTPELSNDFALGVRYARNFTQGWAIEGTLNFNLNTVDDIPTSSGVTEVDMDILFLDVNGVWHWNPEEKYVGYVTGGVGWASADLDTPFTGTPASGPAKVIDDDSGFTVNVGVGGKFFVTEALHIRVEGKYRFVDALVDEFDDSLNTFEAMVGVGWVF